MDARCNAASAPPDAPPLRPAVVCWAKAAQQLVLVRWYA